MYIHHLIMNIHNCCELWTSILGAWGWGRAWGCGEHSIIRGGLLSDKGSNWCRHQCNISEFQAFHLNVLKWYLSNVKLSLNFIKSVKDQIFCQNSIEKETQMSRDLQKCHVANDRCNKIICGDNWLMLFFFIFFSYVYINLVDFQWLDILICDNVVQWQKYRHMII